jgi:hypothetical protein
MQFRYAPQLPTRAAFDTIDLRLAHARFCHEIPRTQTAMSDHRDLIGCQFSAPVLVAIYAATLTFLFLILGAGAPAKVGRVAARGIVATVQRLKVVRHFTGGKVEGHSMRSETAIL